MAIYVIGDLHLSFNENKPMNIFGNNWENHPEKIKKDWLLKVKDEDTVLLLGDFSWSMNLKDTIKDFEYINNLPGRKIMLKGNHDFWWTTVTNMRKFLNENNIQKTDFLYNNSFQIENKIFCGTRGWSILETNNSEEVLSTEKIINRECIRLKLSIEDAIKKYYKLPQDIEEKEILRYAKELAYNEETELIACLHYPPIMQSNILKSETTLFMELLKKYNIKKCFYGHLHGNSIQGAVEGFIDGIEFKLVSADAVDFKLIKI